LESTRRTTSKSIIFRDDFREKCSVFVHKYKNRTLFAKAVGPVCDRNRVINVTAFVSARYSFNAADYTVVREEAVQMIGGVRVPMRIREEYYRDGPDAPPVVTVYQKSNVSVQVE
jgi:hypothetical protein